MAAATGLGPVVVKACGFESHVPHQSGYMVATGVSDYQQVSTDDKTAVLSSYLGHGAAWGGHHTCNVEFSDGFDAHMLHQGLPGCSAVTPLTGGRDVESEKTGFLTCGYNEAGSQSGLNKETCTLYLTIFMLDQLRWQSALASKVCQRFESAIWQIIVNARRGRPQQQFNNKLLV